MTTSASYTPGASFSTPQAEVVIQVIKEMNIFY